MRRPRAVAIALAAAVMSLSAAPMAAQADKPSSEPCAKEQRQVDKAQEALDRLTALYDGKNDKRAKKAKKAQQQRLAQAQARLAACQAEQNELT